MTTDERADAEPSEADVASVRDAAAASSAGSATAFGFDATSRPSSRAARSRSGSTATSLGLLIGPGGRTLLAIQDLARVAAQRRLGDHDTRLRVDVAGYREKRRVAFERFAATVAEQVKESGVARSLDPMPSADRKVLHDALAAIDGVTSRSEGEDPYRRVVVVARLIGGRSATLLATPWRRRSASGCSVIGRSTRSSSTPALRRRARRRPRHGRRSRQRRRRARARCRRGPTRPARSCWSTAGRRAPTTWRASSVDSGSRSGSTVRAPTRSTMTLATPPAAVVARGFGPPA